MRKKNRKFTIDWDRGSIVESYQINPKDSVPILKAELHQQDLLIQTATGLYLFDGTNWKVTDKPLVSIKSLMASLESLL
jgi:hypothetical protein